MHGRNDQVSGLGRAQGQAHDLGSTHFADDEDVGILAQSIDQGLLVARRMRRNLSLA